MAKAISVSAPASKAPAEAQDIQMASVVAPVATKPVKVDVAPLEALAAAAQAEGKVAFIIGNAVRVDN